MNMAHRRLARRAYQNRVPLGSKVVTPSGQRGTVVGAGGRLVLVKHSTYRFTVINPTKFQ